eukprot:9496434-Pyramimonas_sp.AAC.1
MRSARVTASKTVSRASSPEEPRGWGPWALGPGGYHRISPHRQALGPGGLRQLHRISPTSALLVWA